MLRLPLALALLLGAGCAVKREPYYIDERANFGAVQRVAVLPFESFAQDPHAAEKVRQILSIELLRARAFEVVEPGEIGPALAASRVDAVAGMTPEQVRLVGEKLGAQALLFGTVQEMTVDRTTGAAAPVVILQFRLVDAASGQTIWSTVVSREGVSLGTRLFGLGSQSTNAAVQELIQEAIGSLIQ
jgi:TolB-like protein